MALWAAGAGVFDALVHALSLASTGGFSPFPDSCAAYDRAPVAMVAGMFMVLGATSLPLFYLTWRYGLHRLIADVQLRTVLALVSVATVAFAFLKDSNSTRWAVRRFTWFRQ